VKAHHRLSSLHPLLERQIVQCILYGTQEKLDPLLHHLGRLIQFCPSFVRKTFVQIPEFLLYKFGGSSGGAKVTKRKVHPALCSSKPLYEFSQVAGGLQTCMLCCRIQNVSGFALDFSQSELHLGQVPVYSQFD
jgi:hypothetical protein